MFLLSALPGAAGATAAAAQSLDPPSTAVIPAPPELRTIRGQLLDRVGRRELPSVAIGVLRGKAIAWEEAIGWADREAGIPATSETVYPIASISKSITATAALVLIGQGKLRLEDSVGTFVAPFRDSTSRSGAVRVSHLLGHRSGVPHLWHYEYPDRPASLVAQDRLVRDNAFAAAAPGSRFLYSNLGYGVLARVLERAGGAPFQRVAEQALLLPLGMRQTTVTGWVGDAGRARGYSGDGRPNSYRLRLTPDGGAGFFSTLHDLLQYAQFHLAGSATLPRKAAIAVALETTPVKDHYLRGWGVVPLDGATVLISDGEMAGGTSAIVLIPELELASVVLCNATGCPSLDTAVAALESLSPGLAERFGAEVNVVKQQLYTRGRPPAGRFEGFAFSGSAAEPMTAEFSGSGAPVVRLGGRRFNLEGMRWERGTLHAVGSGEHSRFEFQLWLEGDDLRGLILEEVRDDRPGFARLRRVELKAAKH